MVFTFYSLSTFTLLIALLPAFAQSQDSHICYELSHAASALTNPSDAESLPVAVALGPGNDSGLVRSQANPADRIKFWEMFQNGRARWKRAAPDRIQLRFTNGFTVVEYDLVVKSDSMSGTAVVRFDVIDRDPPRFLVSGRRQECPKFDG